MPYLCTSISLRDDEQKALAELMQKYGMNRHAIIKLAIRRFLFPNEKTDIPLDGHMAAVQDGSGTVEPSPDTEDSLTKFVKAIKAAKESKTVDDPPFIFPIPKKLKTVDDDFP